MIRKKRSGFSKIINIISFIIFEMVFCGVLSIILVFHGPFTAIKETYVTTAMSTLSHKYLANIFVSQKEIDEIMKKNVINVATINPELVTVTHNDGIKVNNIKNDSFSGFLIEIDDPSRVKVGTSSDFSDLSKSGLTLEEIVKNEDALGGINAGGFSNGINGAGGTPSGVIVRNEKVIFNEGFSTFRLIGFDTSDKLVLMNNATLSDIKKKKIRDAISFGPILVVNGKPMITSGDGGWGIQPRSAIGQTKDGKILLLVIDGRSVKSLGATLRAVQDVLIEYGAFNAANLDGGSSTTLYYNSDVVNKPSDILGQRSIPSAFIFK